jgi:hypothetical protein
LRLTTTSSGSARSELAMSDGTAVATTSVNRLYGGLSALRWTR